MHRLAAERLCRIAAEAHLAGAHRRQRGCGSRLVGQRKIDRAAFGQLRKLRHRGDVQRHRALLAHERSGNLRSTRFPELCRESEAKCRFLLAHALEICRDALAHFGHRFCLTAEILSLRGQQQCLALIAEQPALVFFLQILDVLCYRGLGHAEDFCGLCVALGLAKLQKRGNTKIQHSYLSFN